VRRVASAILAASILVALSATGASAEPTERSGVKSCPQKLGVVSTVAYGPTNQNLKAPGSWTWTIYATAVTYGVDYAEAPDGGGWTVQSQAVLKTITPSCTFI